MTSRPSHRWFSALGLCALVLVIVGCGSGGDDSGEAEPLRAASTSLQQAMDSVSQAIDVVRGNRDSLDRLGASLEPAIAQTSDIIGLLTPKAGADGPEAMLLAAAREQRSFLQFAAKATGRQSRRSAESALARARSAGRRATDAYADLGQKAGDKTGPLPASTTFNTGRVRDAVRTVNRSSSSSGSSSGSSSSGGSGSSASSGSTSCGDGLSVNSVTTCPFARNVQQAYQNSGGRSSIEVYSPVTKVTYTMSCSDGVPTICRGGNDAVVYIR